MLWMLKETAAGVPRIEAEIRMNCKRSRKVNPAPSQR
jgi:hypothetical protein